MSEVERRGGEGGESPDKCEGQSAEPKEEHGDEKGGDRVGKGESPTISQGEGGDLPTMTEEREEKESERESWTSTGGREGREDEGGRDSLVLCEGEEGGGESLALCEGEDRQGSGGRGNLLGLCEGEDRQGSGGRGNLLGLCEGEDRQGSGGRGNLLGLCEGEDRQGSGGRGDLLGLCEGEDRQGSGGRGNLLGLCEGEEKQGEGGGGGGRRDLLDLCQGAERQGERGGGGEGGGGGGEGGGGEGGGGGGGGGGGMEWTLETGVDSDGGFPLDDYTWVPPGLNPQQVYSYFRSLPDDKVPHLNSEGQKWRIRQMLQQLPPHDSDVRHCSALSDTEKHELRMFSIFRKRKAFGRGDVRVLPLTPSDLTSCEKCSHVMKGGELAVWASRAGRGKVWHPVCFTCSTCGELLVDLLYFQHQGLLYCGRHHAERFKPRCAACDEIIFADECTEAEGRSWHMWHFTCRHCQRQLGGQRYMLRDAAAFCCTCFDQIFAYFCDTCGDRIGLDQGHMTYDGQHWHASADCFKCHTCQVCLLGKPFLPKSGVIYCCVACTGAGCMQTQTPRRSEDYSQELLPSAAARLTSPLSHVLQEGGADIHQALRERYTLPGSLTSSDRDQGYATSSTSDVPVPSARGQNGWSERQQREDALSVVNVHGTLNAPPVPQEARTRHRLSQFSTGDLSPPTSTTPSRSSPSTFTYTPASDSVTMSGLYSLSASESGTEVHHYASVNGLGDWSTDDYNSIGPSRNASDTSRISVSMHTQNKSDIRVVSATSSSDLRYSNDITGSHRDTVLDSLPSVSTLSLAGGSYQAVYKNSQPSRHLTHQHRQPITAAQHRRTVRTLPPTQPSGSLTSDQGMTSSPTPLTHCSQPMTSAQGVTIGADAHAFHPQTRTSASVHNSQPGSLSSSEEPPPALQNTPDSRYAPTWPTKRTPCQSRRALPPPPPPCPPPPPHPPPPSTDPDPLQQQLRAQYHAAGHSQGHSKDLISQAGREDACSTCSSSSDSDDDWGGPWSPLWIQNRSSPSVDSARIANGCKGQDLTAGPQQPRQQPQCRKRNKQCVVS